MTPGGSPRWQRRPGWLKLGEFGPDDSIDRLNLLTCERRRSAAREMREGLSFCLSLSLDLPGGNVANPRRPPPQLYAATDGASPAYTGVLSSAVNISPLPACRARSGDGGRAEEARPDRRPRPCGG